MRKLAIALCPAILLAQTAPSFDVATVKPSDALKNAGLASGWSISASHNGLKIIGTLQTFIRYSYGAQDGYAYGGQDLRISGGPPWLDRDMWEIDAKADRQVTAGELKRMLQSLLTERFKLAVHPETRELPVYSMVPAKGGPKLQRGDDHLRGSFSISGTFLRGTIDSGAFAAHLTSTLHRPVIDNTGLQGIWKFDLTWAPDDVTTGPSIFTAIQEQLGLKLESAKGPVQVLVIDRAEMPSGN
ncbi:MAG TPA: TIGR03435 family protein [Bryobacteraceae bacterium]|nr:TIGR03435 family protein [Bryobacteraceae bacterium]